MQDLGEKFSPDLFTGTGNFTVPIALPPGRNGFQPQLNLVYSTGNGNGPFGLGWSLSVPGVSRKTSKGVPVFDDSKDIFILSGAEDLVAVSQEPSGISYYRPRTEGLFAHILHRHDADNDYWEVQSKDGLVSLYGTPEAAGSDLAVVADPLNRTKVFAWKLTQTTDPFGNRIEYEYERDTGEDGPHHWDQLYLKQIRYVDYTAGEETKFLVTVTFHYEDRPDPFSEYRAGFEIRTRKRCNCIETRTHADEERLIRTYELIYLDQRADLENLGELLPLNGVSLLSKIKVVGHDGDRTEELPPLEFGYSQFEPEGRDFFSLHGADIPARSLASPDIELADLFGNGLPDVLEMNGTVRYWRNLGGGEFDLPRQMREAPAGLHLADRGVQLIDADGDGRIDLMVTTEGLAGYYPLRFGGLWDQRSFQRYELAPSFDLEDPEVRLVDLDGDGVTDALRSGTRMECYFNHPAEGWNNTRYVERRTIDDFPNINFSDPRVKFADMTGDGLQDIVLIYDGNVEYWPNLGHGNWGRRVSMQNNPRFPYGYDPRRILVGDVDGDGIADLVYVEDTRVTLWISQGGNRWSEPIVIQGTPPVTDMDAVRMADMLGTGVAGILWSSDAGSVSRKNMFFLDFTGGVKPYLLNEMNNHMGAITRVGYASSTRFYVEDEKKPETRWKTPLPFPVLVVAKVEVVDRISGGKLTTEYSYHHGYWDGAEREFRGFGRVDQRDTEVFEEYHTQGLHPKNHFETVDTEMFSSPLETRTWFHQGPIGDEFGDWEETDFNNEFWAEDPNVLTRPSEMVEFLKNIPRLARQDALRAMRGRILRTELYALDGTERQERPYTVSEYLHGVMPLPVGEPMPENPEEWQTKVFFPQSLAQRVTQWERGDEPMTSFTFLDDYDKYGQPRSQIGIAVPRGRDFRVEAAAGEPYLATQTETTYAQRDDDDCYIVDRAARTTAYEILNDGCPALSDLLGAIKDGTALRNTIGQTLNFFDGPAFKGLPFGQLGDHGALTHSETLVLTEEILHDAYKSGNVVLDPPEVPPYMALGAHPTWTDEYPQEFRDGLPVLAGYIYHAGGAGSEYATGYFATTERRSYDFHDKQPGKQIRGLLKVTRDPLGRDTTIEYDDYDLLPTRVIDPGNLTAKAVYDYRVFQPEMVTDQNGNRTAFAFTPLGLLERTAIMGKAGEEMGDTLDAPGTRLVHDFLAFARRGQPISVRTVQRVHHVHDTDVPQPERDETIETVEHSDGFGRLLQTRIQAEDVTFGDPVFGGEVLPGDQDKQEEPQADVVGRERTPDDPPNVVVSGWQVYDNKGRVVEKYEPFFSTGWKYTPPKDEERGQKATMYYDPRGQVIRTVNPDGSEQRAIYGIPADSNNPDVYAPTPWEVYAYDENDNAGRTHPDSSAVFEHHWNTPSSAVVDALGRTVKTFERNGPDPENDWYVTRYTYDIQGNLLTVTDALGRVAFRHVYDLANNQLRIENIDAGIRRTIRDAGGSIIEQRDSKGALIMSAYDVLNRPVRLWARDGAEEPVLLREHLIYGDSPDSGLTDAQAAATNLLGMPFKHYDEAGLLLFETYDFKGNVLEKARQVISDDEILAVFPSPDETSPDWQIKPFRVDWHPPDGTTLADHANTLLDVTEYRTSMTYDSLNRIKTLHYPEDVDGERKVLSPHYNRAGALDQVELDRDVYVEHIAYNARGQRSLIAYGNGVMTRYSYDPKTFRLVRLRTEGYTNPEALIYHPAGDLLQDFAYEYDLAGNILTIHDRTPECGIPSQPDRLDRQFSYDPLYRLIEATGRECGTPPATPWDNGSRCTDINSTKGYREKYEYDPVGNMTRLRHNGGPGGFTRNFVIVRGGNRLAEMGVGGAVFAYTYDASGNLISETTARHFEWDHSDQMRVYRTQIEDAEPSVHAHYLYDTDGQRVKKLVRKHGGKVEVTVYIDAVFEHHSVNNGETQENDTLHVMDDEKRILLIRVGSPFPGDATPAVKYHWGDHLGSSNLVIDGTGNWINREEYTPYGETSFGSFAKKRYRFTGKERDEESGLNYHGARYYAPWLGRWVSCDPAGPGDSYNLYVYTKNKPISSIDNYGYQTEEEMSGQPEYTSAEENLHRIVTETHEKTSEQGTATEGPGEKEHTPSVLECFFSPLGRQYRINQASRIGFGRPLEKINAERTYRASVGGAHLVHHTAMGATIVGGTTLLVGVGGGLTAGPAIPAMVEGVKSLAVTVGAATPVLVQRGQHLMRRAGAWVQSLLNRAVGSLSGRTGTGWDSIKVLQPTLHAGSSIPTSFELTIAGQRILVQASATKHMFEHLMRYNKNVSFSGFGINMRGQAMLAEFAAAVRQAFAQGIEFNQKMYIGRWELIFGQRELFKTEQISGLITYIYHAKIGK